MHFWIKMKIRNRNTEHDLSIFSLRSADFGMSCKKLLNVFCTVRAKYDFLEIGHEEYQNIQDFVLISDLKGNFRKSALRKR